MNLRELARLANVSVSTVSKAFNNAPDISEDTRELVFAAAKKYGCYEKYHKEKYFKKIIAIICPELRSYHYADPVDRLQKLVENNNGIVLISTDDFIHRKQAELIEYYTSFLHVDGVFVFGDNHTSRQGYETPIIYLAATTESGADSVCCDLSQPISQAIDHLLDMHHRKIAFLSENLTTGKETLFRHAMEQKGLPFPADYLVRSDYRFEKAGEDGMERLMKLPDPPTAVVCAYDYMACGAISYLTRNGYQVPDDFSIIGMDNINASQHMDPALTSIDSGTDEIVQIAWDLMCKKLDDRQYRLRQKIIITGELIIRETTAPCKAAE